jgi:transposase
LPRIEEINSVPLEMRICLRCGAEMTTVAHSSCEYIDVIPAQYVVVVRKDETVACPNDDTIVSAPTPPAIVERGKLGDTLIVEAVCDKFLEHTPVERQRTRSARAGGKRPGCWSHGRRRLVEAARAGDAIALEGLRTIAPLFAVERDGATPVTTPRSGSRVARRARAHPRAGGEVAREARVPSS